MDGPSLGAGLLSVGGGPAPAADGAGAPVRTLLIFGATGMTGHHVVEKATSLLPRSTRVVVYVRNPGKLPPSHRSKVDVCEGEFTDGAAVKRAVLSVRPDSIIVAASVGPGAKRSARLNAILVPVIVEALAAAGRTSACSLFYLSGAGSPNPPVPTDPDAVPYSCFFRFIMWALGLRAAVEDNNDVHNFLHTSDPALNAVVIKMGRAVEGASVFGRRLTAVPCLSSAPWGFCQVACGEGVRFCDVATLLVESAAAAMASESAKAGAASTALPRGFYLMSYHS